MAHMQVDATPRPACPRCGGPVHCGAADVQGCWCSRLTLDSATLEQLHARYQGCLCAGCLAQLAKAAADATPRHNLSHP